MGFNLKKYSIAFLLGYPEISGGTNVIMEHAVGLKKRGHNVAIITELPFEKKRLAWHPEAMSLDCFSHEQVKDMEFDLAIATWWRSVYNLPYVPAKKYAYFCQSIETRFFDASDTAMKALVEFTYRLNLPVVTEANWIASYLNTHYGIDSTLVRNGIKKDVFKKNGEVVDNTRNKGVRVLVEGPIGVHFKKTEDTIRICQEAGIEDIWLLTSSEVNEYPGISRIFSRIPIKEVSTIYRSCDVLVKLSTVEGMFGPPLEMMHCGGTAITNNVTGYDEYMVNYRNGIVVPMGDEQQVIKSLRLLKQNPDFLLKLKNGANETARSWPDWPKAVEEMEAFIIKTIEKDVDYNGYLDSQMSVLKAALKFAGPLESYTKQVYSRKELLEIFKTHLKKYVSNKSPKLYNGLRKKIQNNSIKEFDKLEQLSSVPNLEMKNKYHFCFVGDKGKHFFTYRKEHSKYNGLFIDNRNNQLSDLNLKKINEFIPDVIFIYNKEIIENLHDYNLPGIKIFISTENITSENVQFYKKYFKNKSDKLNDLYLIHASSKYARLLMENSIEVIGSINLPIHIENHTVNERPWANRNIPFLLVGKENDFNKDYKNTIDESNIKYIHVTNINDQSIAESLLLETKFVIYLPQEKEDVMKSSNIIRDILCDAIVISEEFEPNYSFMPNEHYINFKKPSELRSILLTLVEFEDKYDHIQSVGKEKASEFMLDNQYISIIEELNDLKGIIAT